MKNKEILEQLEKLPWSSSYITCYKKKYTRQDFLAICLDYWNVTEIAEYLGCSARTVLSVIKDKLAELQGHGDVGGKIVRRLGLRRCTNCLGVRPFSDFYPRLKSEPNKLESRCKKCQSNRAETYYIENKEHLKQVSTDWNKNNPGRANARTRRYVATTMQRMPPWADSLAIDQMYINCEKGHEVDHIIPLRGRLVSGLHVLHNLQYLTQGDNRRKSNKYEV